MVRHLTGHQSKADDQQMPERRSDASTASWLHPQPECCDHCTLYTDWGI
jgi:hypothetical protein